MKRFIALLLCLCSLLPMVAGCGKKSAYEEPAPPDPALRGTISDSTYTNNWLGISLTIPKDLVFADTTEYNRSLQLGSSNAVICEFIATAPEQESSLQIHLCLETLPQEVTSPEQWLKDNGYIPANATLSTITLAEQEFLAYGGGQPYSTWQLFRVQDNSLVRLRVRALAEEYDLESVASLFHPTGTTLEKAPKLIAQPTFRDLVCNGQPYAFYMPDYDYHLVFVFEPDGTLYNISCGRYEIDDGGVGTYTVIGNLVYKQATLCTRHHTGYWLFDPEAFTVTTVSDPGYIRAHKPGIPYTLKPYTNLSAASVIQHAKFWENTTYEVAFGPY